MVSESNIDYVDGYILKGGFKVDPKYYKKKLLVRFEGEEQKENWRVVGTINYRGLVGFESPFKINYPRTLEVRILDGDFLGTVRVGSIGNTSTRKLSKDERRFIKRKEKRMRRLEQLDRTRILLFYSGLVSFISLFFQNIEIFQFIFMPALGVFGFSILNIIYLRVVT